MVVSIEDFLRHNVESYLFGDLENMATLGPLRGTDYGAAGYPTLQAILSGIELLGMLVYPEKLDWDLDKEKNCQPRLRHFHHYWTEVLCRLDASYEPWYPTARHLARNPLAHGFQTTGKVVVTKEPMYPGIPPFALLGKTGPIVIDCIAFAGDLWLSYNDLVRPVVFPVGDLALSNPVSTRADMEARLDELLHRYDELEAPIIAKLARSVDVFIPDEDLTRAVTWGPAASSGTMISIPAASAWASPLASGSAAGVDRENFPVRVPFPILDTQILPRVAASVARPPSGAPFEGESDKPGDQDDETGRAKGS